MQTRKFTTKQIVQIALMSAIVVVGTNMRIKIPVGGDSTMLHLGNVFCLLSGLLFGALPGGLAAGLGSALFDLTSEYANEAWITFINKFAMGYVTGLIAYWGKSGSVSVVALRVRTVVGAVTGSVAYCVLYLFKNIIEMRFVNGAVWQAVWPVIAVKASVTFTNAIVAVIASVILAFALRPTLERAHLIEKLT